MFKAAPYIVVMATLGGVRRDPGLGPDLVVSRYLDLGIFYLLAISSVGVLGVLMAGWASANKYSLMGGLRAAGQLIAYELPLVLAVVAVVVQAGTMSLVGIVEAQARGPGSPSARSRSACPFILKGQIIGFIIFGHRHGRRAVSHPLRHADRRVRADDGVYLTEYSSIRFTMFFLGEYASLIALSMPSRRRSSSAATGSPSFPNDCST